MRTLPELFKTAPAVFAAGNTYQIMIPVHAPALLWIEVDGERYGDHNCGIMRSNTDMHRVCVPMEALNAAGSYTVIYRKIIERKPYFPLTEEEVRTTYPFHPVPTFAQKEAIHFYHLADVHGNPAPAIAAADFFGDDLDFLILNGDIIDHSGDLKNFDVIYQIADALTHGEKPIICARGNHDMRGFFAENIIDYIPHVNNKTYYTLRLGDLWFVVLDCAEDKNDCSKEYGWTVFCHPFRTAQTAFLKDISAHAEEEFAAPNVARRFVISHHPFTKQLEPPFNIEADTYWAWSHVLREQIHPDLMISGHIHTAEIYEIGGPHDNLGQCCPIAVAADPDHNETYVGGAFTVTKDMITVSFTNSHGEVCKTWTM